MTEALWRGYSAVSKYRRTGSGGNDSFYGNWFSISLFTGISCRLLYNACKIQRLGALNGEFGVLCGGGTVFYFAVGCGSVAELSVCVQDSAFPETEETQVAKKERDVAGDSHCHGRGPAGGVQSVRGFAWSQCAAFGIEFLPV